MLAAELRAGMPALVVAVGLLSLALSALLGAAFLRFAARHLFKFQPPGMMAFRAMLVSLTAAFVLGRLHGYSQSVSGGTLGPAASGLFVLANFLAMAVAFALMIETPRLARLGFWRGCVLSFAVVVVAAIVVGLVHAIALWLL